MANTTAEATIEYRALVYHRRCCGCRCFCDFGDCELESTFICAFVTLVMKSTAPLAEAVAAFVREQGFTLVREFVPDHSYVIDHGPRDRQALVVIDPINPERRPGKPKGKAQGREMRALERMEEIFQVMKDFRFFALCLPGVFGMGRYGESFDWVMLKYYDGTRYDETRGDVPMELAAEAAMMVFDLTQVPVLKFSKKVETEHYPNRLKTLHPQFSVLVEHGIVSAERAEELVNHWSTFFDQNVPTLYTIQNGCFSPKKFLHLEESIVLLDWADARVTTVEDVVAYCWIAMFRQPQWQSRFLDEVQQLLDTNPEWLSVMKQWNAAQRAIFLALQNALTDEERTFLQTILNP